MGIQSGPKLGQEAKAFIPPQRPVPGHGLSQERAWPQRRWFSADEAISEGHQLTLFPVQSQLVSPEQGAPRGHRHDNSRQQDQAYILTLLTGEEVKAHSLVGN